MLSLIFRAHLSRIAAPKDFVQILPYQPVSDYCRSDQVSSDPRRHPSDDHHFSPVPRYRGSVEATQKVPKHFSSPPSSEKQFSSGRLLSLNIVKSIRTIPQLFWNTCWKCKRKRLTLSTCEYMKEINGVIVGQKHNCYYGYGRMKRKCSRKDGRIHISAFWPVFVTHDFLCC